jgi:hypothetical protein
MTESLTVMENAGTVSMRMSATKMKKTSYEYTRNLLVIQRKKLMDMLEDQGDFPDPKLIEAYENNKREIIQLDDAWETQK